MEKPGIMVCPLGVYMEQQPAMSGIDRYVDRQLFGRDRAKPETPARRGRRQCQPGDREGDGDLRPVTTRRIANERVDR